MANLVNSSKMCYYKGLVDIKKALKNAPLDPGVYIFKNKRGRILYIGKAVNLRARLRSYANPGWKENMLREAKNVSWEVLSSDIEALIRESELVKKHKPHYNILLRDDKNYFFVAFSKDLFQRVFLTHQPIQARSTKHEIRNNIKIQKDKNKNVSDFDIRISNFNHIGPFTEGEPIKRALHLLRRAFPYCICSSKTRHKRKCVNAEIGKCLGFCCTDIAHTKNDIIRYRANITAIKKVLSGKTKTLERELLKKMAILAKRRDYERAAIMRNQIASLKRIFRHSPYLKKDMPEERERALRALQELFHLQQIPERIECYDISHHQGDTSVASMIVFENGMPSKNEYRKFIIKHVTGINDPAMIHEVLSRRLAHAPPPPRADGGWKLPDLIIVDGGKAQLGAALRAIKTSDVHPTSDVFRPSLAAIAKREEEFYISGIKTPIKLKTLPPPLLHLITHLRDEAHRFAVVFHRKRRGKLVIRG